MNSMNTTDERRLAYNAYMRTWRQTPAGQEWNRRRNAARNIANRERRRMMASPPPMSGNTFATSETS